MDTLDKGLIHTPGKKESEDKNGSQLKTYELFTSGIFSLTIFDYI
jgi:hypothetical protein